MLPINARALDPPVPLIFRPSPRKETGGPPEFPDYPFKHMPFSKTPVVSLLHCHSTAWTAAFRSLNPVGFHRSARLILMTTTIHISELNQNSLCPCFPSASHTTSRRSHFGSATGPVASFWPVGICLLCLRRLTRWVIMTNFKGYYSLSQRPGFISARWAICYLMSLTDWFI